MVYPLIIKIKLKKRKKKKKKKKKREYQIIGGGGSCSIKYLKENLILLGFLKEKSNTRIFFNLSSQ